MDETGLKMEFDTLKRAQAAGDREALGQAGRPVQVLDLGADCVGGLSRLTDMLLAAGGAVKR